MPTAPAEVPASARQRAAQALAAARQALGQPAAPAAQAAAPTHKLSNRQWENLLRQHYISVRRTGLCGSCSEIYYDRGPAYGCGKPSCGVGCDCDRYLEI